MIHPLRMPRSIFFFAIVSGIFLLPGYSLGQQPKILYTLGMAKPQTHLFEVGMRLESLPSEQLLEFILPVWRPGRYMISDFASGVQEFEAFDGEEKSLQWEKVDKTTWRVATKGASTVQVRYKVYANEFNQRTRGLNSEHGFADGTAVFMYVQAYRNLPLNLEVQPYKAWHITTGLEGGGRRFSAPSYDYFIDCPLEIGTQKDFTFEVDGVPHVLSIAGGGNWNADTLIRDISKIVTAQKNFWGEFPYEKYVFLVHCMSNPTGATEHLNSTIVQTGFFVFRNPMSYRMFLGIVSHEYFHTWNVKQLRPKGLHPYDFTKENYSRELWIAEGTTSYYGGLLMIRSGFTKAESYLEGIGDGVQADRERHGNLVEPVSEASFDTWVKDSRGTEQDYNAESDIYNKGANASMLLDLQIRKLSSNRHSLDEVMRAMYKRFPLSGTGYTLKDFQAVAEEVAGASLQGFFNDYIYGTKPLPWEESLRTAGIDLIPKDSLRKPWIGVAASDAGERTKIRNVVAGSPAEEAGIEIGDELLAFNGFRVRANDFIDRIGEMKIGDAFTITIFRNDALRQIQVKAGSAPVPAYTASKVKSPTPDQKAVYESWLQTKW
jgi:predicted metalloprotease with PDZ domain